MSDINVTVRTAPLNINVNTSPTVLVSAATAGVQGPVGIQGAGVLSFSGLCTSGVDSEFIKFSSNGSNYTFYSIPKVVCSFQNTIDSNLYNVVINAIKTSGINVSYSDNIVKTGYSLSIITNL
jgi:hypothetical protein